MSNRARKPEEPDNSQERWLVSYADFITLLFAFFVILYATSERDAEKTKKFQNSLEKFLVKAGSFGETGAKVEQGEKNFTVIAPPIQTYRQASPDDTKVLDAVQSQIESQLTEAERKKYLIDISPEEKGVRMVLAAREIYALKGDKFQPGAMAFVDHIGQIIQSQKKPVSVEGHVPPGMHGAFASTWDLASARAVNFVRYINKKFQVPQNQFAVSSYGDSRPLVEKQPDAQDNERIELLLYFNDSEF